MKRFLLFAVLVVGCQPPGPVNQPVTVRASELTTAYRDDPTTASQAYTGRSILIGLSNPVRVGSEIHWHFGSVTFPALVVCRFADGVPIPDPTSRLWITGTCRGRFPDGKRREFSGYDFHVLIVDCHPAAPPIPGR